MLMLPNKLNALVIGDMMIDRYIEGSVSRLSPEAVCPVLEPECLRVYPGGAGNVAAILSKAGCRVAAVGSAGDDEWQQRLCDALRREGVDCSMISQFARPTTLKTRYVATDGTQLLRMDEDSQMPFDRTRRDELAEALGSEKTHLVFAIDYNKGLIDRTLMQFILDNAGSKARIVADVKVADPARYSDVWLLKGNEKEIMALAAACGYEPRDAEDALLTVREVCRAENVVATCGDKGLKGIDSNGELISVEGVECTPVNVTGAGDVATVWLAITLYAGSTLRDAMECAAKAAALSISKSKRYHPIPVEVILNNNKRINGTALKAFPQRNGKVVFTNGCFDVLHAGHIDLLRRAKACGKMLIVGLNSDESVSRLKGSSRPINTLEARISVLEALECVDAVVPFDEDTPEQLIRAIRPDVLVKGGDYTEDDIAGAEFVRSYGGEVKIFPHRFKLSTTQTLKKLDIR